MKNNRIEIPITILTEYEYTNADDANEFSREQIEHAQLYLRSVFSFMRHAAGNLESDFRHDEAGRVSGFCYDLTNFCEIGDALCSAIWKNVSEMRFKASFEASGNETIAEKISFLINAENVPSEISEAISDALTGMQNASKQTAISELENSPEYIERILQDYGKSEGAGDE